MGGRDVDVAIVGSGSARLTSADCVVRSDEVSIFRWPVPRADSRPGTT